MPGRTWTPIVRDSRGNSGGFPDRRNFRLALDQAHAVRAGEPVSPGADAAAGGDVSGKFKISIFPGRPFFRKPS
jgi:hypothetical protein